MINLSKYDLEELIEIKQKVVDEISSHYARRRRKYEVALDHLYQQASKKRKDER